MSVSTDPFSRVEQAIYDGLFMHPPLAALVRPGNRVSLTSPDPERANPFKERKAEADFPALEILPAGGGEFKHPSGTLLFAQRYQIGMASSSVRTNQASGNVAGINPVKWAVLCALTRMRTSAAAPGAPALPGVACAVAVVIGDYSDALTDPEKAVPGWVSLMGVEVHMKFSTAEMIA